MHTIETQCSAPLPPQDFQKWKSIQLQWLSIQTANDVATSSLKEISAMPLARLDSVSAEMQGVRFTHAVCKEG